jgi:CRISPR system Cascade subunit CasE
MPDPYEWHRMLWHAFPGKREKERHFIFRVDPERRSILMLSQSPPVQPENGVLCFIRSKSFEPKIAPGDILRASLRASPSKRDSASRRRLGLLAHDEQLAWLHRKMIGARVLKAETRGPEPLYFRKNRNVGILFICQFEFLIEVLDPGLLMEAMRRGIGPGKVFGCGLLLLQRASAA